MSLRRKDQLFMEGKLSEEQVKTVTAPWRLSPTMTGFEDRLLAALNLYEHFPLDIAVTGGTQAANAKLVKVICGPTEVQSKQEKEEEEEDAEEEEESNNEADDDEEEDSEEEEEEEEEEKEEEIKPKKRVRIAGDTDGNEEHTGDTIVSSYPNCVEMLKHPHISNVRIWTLEGHFSSNPIIQQGNQQLYFDVLLVLTSELHQEEQMRLAVEVGEKGKAMYFIRAQQEWDIVQEKPTGACKTCAWERLKERSMEYQKRRNAAGVGPAEGANHLLIHKLTELSEIRGTLEAALPELRKKAFSQFLVDVVKELRVSKIQRNVLPPLVSTVVRMGKISKEDVAHISELFQSKDLTDHPSKLPSVLTTVEHFRLDIGVVGEAGCGSSSLVNALLGLKNKTEGSAPTGVTETTKEAMAYSFPEFPNVLLWDFPGMGRVGRLREHSTGSSPAEHPLLSPLSLMCDVLIVVSPLRLSLSCIRLLQQFSCLRKVCYLVLSKADLIEEESLEEVRNWSDEILGQVDLKQNVFLVSALHPDKMDFPKLRDELLCTLPAQKRVAFAHYVAKLLEQDIFWKRAYPCKQM